MPHILVLNDIQNVKFMCKYDLLIRNHPPRPKRNSDVMKVTKLTHKQKLYLSKPHIQAKLAKITYNDYIELQENGEKNIIKKNEHINNK